MLFSCGSPVTSFDIKLLDMLRAARAGNCSQMVPTSCTERSFRTRHNCHAEQANFTNKEILERQVHLKLLLHTIKCRNIHLPV